MALALGGHAAANPTARVAIDRIAAVINDNVILASELELRVAPLRASVEASVSEPRERERRVQQLTRQTLDAMVDEELVLQAAQAARITVDDKEVDNYLELLKKDHKLDDDQLREAMAAQGVTRTSLRNDIARQRMVSQTIAPKVAVTDDDVRQRYDELSRRSSTIKAVELSQLIIDLPDREHPTEQQLAAAKQRATAALDRVRAGEPFAKVASELSDDTTTRPTGGMLGWVDPATMTGDLEQVVRQMAVGDVRGPIRIDRGFALYFASNHQRNELRPLPEMKDAIRDELQRKALAKLSQAWVDDLRKQAYIAIK